MTERFRALSGYPRYSIVEIIAEADKVWPLVAAGPGYAER
jgi:hypothetical protein